jgi:nucleoside-diphosphate-sugar epimerase
MRVVVVGATGNVGTSVLEALAGDASVDEIVAVARRPLRRAYPRTTFVGADVVTSELEPIFRGADAVVHLAWLIQPGRDESVTYGVNVIGSERVFAATAHAGVPALVYASSLGAYSPGPKDHAVDESWPTEGIPSSFYSRHKVATERRLDRLEQDHPQLRVVRMRPALIFKREAATEIRRLFVGPLLPGRLLRRELIPIVPDHPRLRFQAVHSLDVADAYRRAILGDVRGAFNIAAEPVIDPAQLARMFGARRVRVPALALRAGAVASYALRLQPSEPGWLDMGLGTPLLDTTRARSELGWEPTRSATEALGELVAGLREGADFDTPPLARSTTGPGRLRELLTGIGARQ